MLRQPHEASTGDGLTQPNHPSGHVTRARNGVAGLYQSCVTTGALLPQEFRGVFTLCSAVTQPYQYPNPPQTPKNPFLASLYKSPLQRCSGVFI